MTRITVQSTLQEDDSKYSKILALDNTTSIITSLKLRDREQEGTKNKKKIKIRFTFIDKILFWGLQSS